MTILWQPHYPPFRDGGIPDIQDFNVLPPFRRQGIGTALLDRAEQIVAERSPVVGIGVGLYADYGAAQCLYARRGYIPDGRGLMYNDEPVERGESIMVDDALTLYFARRLVP